MKRKNGREHGEVFTKLDVVSYLLDEVAYTACRDLRAVSILEPAAGQGAFTMEIIKRLYQSSLRFHFDFIQTLNINTKFVELETSSLQVLKKKLFKFVEQNGFDSEKVDETIFINSDFLLTSFDISFDCIVGNPPYIRNEIIDTNLKQEYKHRFKTFKYRADLYVLFYEHSLKNLAKDGALSFICSNRWLFNQYGQPLRELVGRNFHLSKVINIENANVFDEEVIAYPCITTIKNDSGVTLEYFESTQKLIDINSLEFKVAAAPKTGSWQNIFLSYNLEHNALEGIKSQGFKIGIGVATGADKVFLVDELEASTIEPERIMPIIKSGCLKGNKIRWDGVCVLNPFENEKLCDLDSYPLFKNYLEQHKDVLSNRHVAKRNPKHWYKTIDRIKPSLQRQYKLLLPDFAGCQFLFIDEGNYYPHHNVYYITNKDLDSLKIIAGFLMSDFVKHQLSQIGIRMNGGLPRYQSQALKKLRVPKIKNLTPNNKKQLVEAYDNRCVEVLNAVVENYCKHFQITDSKPTSPPIYQTELFSVTHR